MGVKTMPAVGARGAIHIGQETTYGVVAIPTHLIEFTSESISADEDTLESEAIRDTRGKHHIIRGTLDIQGDINFEQNASGLGILYKNALGDYIKLQGVDGGIHARVERDGVVVIRANDDFTEHVDEVLTADRLSTRYVVPFTRDHTGGFSTEAGERKFVAVTRDNLGNLDILADSYVYDDYTHGTQTFMTANAVADALYHPSATQTLVKLTVSWVMDAEGQMVPPKFCESGGVIQVGNARQEFHYLLFDEGTELAGATLYLSPVGPNGANPASVPAVLAENAFVIGMAGIVKKGLEDTSGTPALLDQFADGAAIAKIGNWIYQEIDDQDVFTHHIERGKRLPVGLTVEVDRDAAIFVYTGVRVNTVSCTFESGDVASGTFSLLGKAEHAMATLQNDVVPDAVEIVVDKVYAFPSAAQAQDQDPFDPAEDKFILTIGEETDIYYQWIRKNADGTFTIGGIPTSADAGYEKNAIEQFHPRRSNVDSRSSIKAATTVKGQNTPLSSFEIMVYIDGYFEEVLSASLTLNNNLDTDKFFLGDRFRAFAAEGLAEVEGSLGMEFDDGKHYVKFLNGEYFTLEIKCINEDDDALIGQSQVPAQAYFFSPRCKYSGDTPNIESRDIINHDMPFMGTYDDKHKTTDLVVILVNGLSQDAEAA